MPTTFFVSRLEKVAQQPKPLYYVPRLSVSPPHVSVSVSRPDCLAGQIPASNPPWPPCFAFISVVVTAPCSGTRNRPKGEAAYPLRRPAGAAASGVSLAVTITGPPTASSLCAQQVHRVVGNHPTVSASSVAPGRQGSPVVPMINSATNKKKIQRKKNITQKW